MDTIDTFRDIRQKICDGEILCHLGEFAERMIDLADTALRSDTDTNAAIALLEDAFSGIGIGMALLDENLNFVLFNETFTDFSFAGIEPPKVGENVEMVTRAQFRAGYYQCPAGSDWELLCSMFLDAIASCGPAITLTRADGQHFEISSKRTQLGGYLISVVDVSDRVTAQTAQKDLWDMISDLVNSLEEGVSVWDAEMRFVMCNDQYMRDMASHRDTPFPVGMRGEDVIAETYHSGILTILPEGATEEQIVEYYMTWARDCAGPEDIFMADGRFITATAKKTDLGGVLITTRDVTEARTSDARARDMLREAVEALDDGIMLFDKDLRLEVFNDRAVEFFQRDNKCFTTGEAFYDIWQDLAQSGKWVPSDDLSPAARASMAVKNVRNYVKYREVKLSDGREFLASSHKTDRGGYLLVYRDKTEHAHIEGLFTDVIEHLPVGIAVEGADQQLTHCNEAFSRIYNIPADELKDVGRETRISRLYDMISAVNGVSCEGVPLSAHSAVMQDHTENFVPVEMTFKSGRHIRSERATTRRGETILVLTDTTSVKTAQEERLTSINDAIEGTAEALVLFDKDAKYVLSNQAWQEMFWVDLAPPQVGETAEAIFRRLLDADYYLIPEGMTKDAFFSAAMALFHSHGKNFPMDTAQGRNVLASSHKTRLDGYLLSFRDVTEERSSEIRARDMLLDAFEAIDEGLVLCDENMNYLFGNKAWKSMNFDGVEHLIPEPGDSVVENVAALVAAGHYDMGDMSADEYMHWMMGEMAQHGKLVHVKFKNGRHVLGSSHLTAFGGSLLFIREITEQQHLEAELEQQREIAHQNEKLSALGELLAGVAHELNNPLSVVFGYSQMLQGKINDPVLSERVDLICQSSERAAKIVRTFLAMARQRPTTMEPCPVNDVVETALEVSSYSLKTNGTEVIVDLDESDPLVNGDLDQLAQVFSNLIVNAGYAVGRKGARGQIRVRTKLCGDFVQIDISDNGNGIPKDIQSRIFEPFFTTKDVGEGTGIGLAFSHRIVKSHEGTLSVVSEPGEGATFTVRLLRAEDPDQAIAGAGETSQMGHSVLVVDDEEGVARLISDMLSDAGYRVTLSTDPTEALKIAEAREFDAVLSDFKMPQMNGETFFRMMQVVAPENARRTGFVTGDAMSAQVSSFFAKSGRPHIEKPIMKDELDVLLAFLIGEDTK